MVSAGPLILTMLSLADVGGALAMPLPDSPAPLHRSTHEVSAEQAVALRWLLGVLDHDGVGPRPVEARSLPADGQGDAGVVTPGV